MDRKKIKSIFYRKVIYSSIALSTALIGLIMLISGIVQSSVSGSMIIQILGMTIFFTSIVIDAVVWRCPVCKVPLQRRHYLGYIKYCSNCNAKLK